MVPLAPRLLSIQTLMDLRLQEAAARGRCPGRRFWSVPGMGVLIGLGAWRAAHHLEHADAARPDEPVTQRRGEDSEDDVEHGGVIPLDGSLRDRGVAAGRDQAEAAEDQLDQ